MKKFYFRSLLIIIFITATFHALAAAGWQNLGAQFTTFTTSIVYDGKGDIYGCDGGVNIRRYDVAGDTIDQTLTASPICNVLAFDGSYLYGANSSGTFARYDTGSNQWERLSGGVYSASVSLASDGHGSVYMWDSGSLMLRKFNTSTSQWTSLQLIAFTSGATICCDGNGDVYGADGSGYVAKYSSSAGLSTLSSINGFRGNYIGLVYDGSGYLYGADGFQNFKRYNVTTNTWETLGYAFTGFPIAMTADSNYLYALDGQGSLERYATAVPEPSTLPVFLGIMGSLFMLRYKYRK